MNWIPRALAGALAAWCLVMPALAANAAAAIVVPPAPRLAPVPLTTTDLTAAAIHADVQQLNGLFAAHPGDGQVRGPDALVYNIDASIQPSLHEVAGHLSLHLRNNLGQPIRTLYFNVWPDAPHYRWQGGYTAVFQPAVDGRPAAFTLHGTVLQITPATPIAPGQAAQVALGFLSKLPHLDDRYGWYGTSIRLGNWFPVLAVHDAHGWITPPYYTDGESFYSLTAAFHVNITAPAGLTVAVAGGTTAATRTTPQTNYTLHATALGVRDVALVADSAYQVMTANVGRTALSVYYPPAQSVAAKRALSVATASLAAYSDWYGPYPYPSFDVCLMNGNFGGMEYPQLVMISLPPSAADTPIQAAVVAHEAAHQWFYGLVGDNQYRNPFVDESFATFTENRFHHTLASLSPAAPTDRHPGDPVSAFPSSDFPGQSSHGETPDDYTAAVYDNGAETLADLRQRLGQSVFDALLRAYVQQYAYRVATTQDFVSFVAKFTGQDWSPFFAAHGIDPASAAQAPQQAWVGLEEAQNQRSWN